MSPPERTAQEREQARLEREARRAGDPSPPTPKAPPPRRPQKPPPHEQRAAKAAEILRRRRERADADNDTPKPRRRAVALGLAGLVLAAGAWLALSLLQPFEGDGDREVVVAIPKGSGVGDIADLLEEKGVVSSSFFFEARATLSGRRNDLKPGRFKLRQGMSYAAALDALTSGPPPDVVTVTVPEGRSRRELRRIADNGLRGDYLAATRRSAELNPRSYGAQRARDLEGFLFPATYELKRGRPVGDLITQQLQAFRREFGKLDLRAAKRKNLTPYDVLTIASMVEREAQIARERPLVASVIYNRLREGIPLGIDATVRFATNNWTRPLTQSQLAIDSPYNTRNRKGLPPGPIGSPGVAAIRAAARPARTRFLFYVVKPGTCGEHDFSRTDAEFQRDVKRYNSERARRGGKSPTKC